MKEISITFKIQATLPESEFKEQVATALYKEGVLSAHQARFIVGGTRREFEEILVKNGVALAELDDFIENNNTIDPDLSNFFSDFMVTLPNKKDVFLYLSKNPEVITSILEVCTNAKSSFPDSTLILHYDDGADEEESTIPSLILYVKQDDMSKEVRKNIRNLADHYEEVFAKYDTFFHTEPYLKNYV